MRYFKDKQGKIWGFETINEIKKFYKGTSSLKEITEEEKDAILNPAPSLYEQKQRFPEMATAAVDTMIQDVIDEYNEMHGLRFKNVDSLFKYTKNTKYTHYQFCSDVIEWVTSETIGVGVWEKARDIQDKVISGDMDVPSEEEFLGMLPEYTGFKE